MENESKTAIVVVVFIIAAVLLPPIIFEQFPNVHVNESEHYITDLLDGSFITMASVVLLIATGIGLLLMFVPRRSEYVQDENKHFCNLQEPLVCIRRTKSKPTNGVYVYSWILEKEYETIEVDEQGNLYNTYSNVTISIRRCPYCGKRLKPKIEVEK